MTKSSTARVCTGLLFLLGACVQTPAAPAAAGAPYDAITATLADSTVTLTGRDLTVEQLVQIARAGAKVRLSEQALRREADNYGLLLEAQAENVPVYLMNRGGGVGRANVILQGDPMSPANKALIEKRELAAFKNGALEGDGPEIADEQIVRATMVVRANEMTFETPSPQLAQMLLDFLNRGITPVMQSRGSFGESDLYVIANIGAAMVGEGEVYYRGSRMSAALGLRSAGLTPLKPFALDSSTLANSNGYATALAALLVSEGRQALDWADLTDAIDLNAMNGSVAPLSLPVQWKRPDQWLNWDAARILSMLQGGYLFDRDPQRVLADADSLRASAIRQGAAWAAWGALRDAVVMQMNSSDHNPVVNVGLSPGDSWELSTPQMMQYYVKGGAYSHGEHGYVIASANWDPYPMANQIEAFTNALANLGVAVTQRIYRFDNPFFTLLKPADLLKGGKRMPPMPQGTGTLILGLWQELQVLAVPVSAEGASADSQGNGDIQSQAPLKAARARQAVDVTLHLLAQDFLNGTYWLALRRLEKPSRVFGPAVEAVIRTFPTIAPEPDTPEAAVHAPSSKVAYEFLKNTRLEAIFPAVAMPPDPGPGSARADPRD